MPQQINWDDLSNWEPVVPETPKIDWDNTSNWEPVEPKKLKEPTWTQTGVANALGILPAVGGGILGSMIEPGLGTWAIGGLGAAWGDYLKQQYETEQGLRNEWNPGLTLIAGGAGSIPVLGAEVPAAGAKINDLASYIVKAPLQHALQGATINAATSVPASLAETGELPSLGQVGKSAAYGAITGGVGGAAFGSLPAYMRLKRLYGNVEAPQGPLNMSVTDENAPIAPQQRLLTGQVTETESPRASTRPPSAPPPPPTGEPIPHVEGEDIIVPGIPNREQMDNLSAEGYEPVGPTPDKKGIIFRLMHDESGTLDLEQLKTSLRKILNREPTPEETTRAAFELNSSIQMRPGPTEQTGRVAPFKEPEPPQVNVPPQATMNQYLPLEMTDQIHPRMPSRVQRLTDPMKVAEQLQHWTKIASQTTDPVQLQIMQDTIEAAKARLAELQSQIPYGSLPEDIQSPYGPETPENTPTPTLAPGEDYPTVSFSSQGPRDEFGYRILDQPPTEPDIPELNQKYDPSLNEHNDFTEARSATSVEQAQDVVQFWTDMRQRAIDEGSVVDAKHAHEVLDVANQTLSRLEGRDAYGQIPRETLTPEIIRQLQGIPTQPQPQPASAPTPQFRQGLPFKEPEPQQGLPFGPMGPLQEQSRLANIANASRTEPVDLSLPQPEQRSFRQLPPTDEGPAFQRVSSPLEDLRRILKREPTQEEFEDYVTFPVTKVPPGSAAGAGEWPQKVRGRSEYEAHGMVRSESKPRDPFGSKGNYEPSFAKVKGGGLYMSVNEVRGVENLTNDYSSPLGKIIAREGIQNSLDAAEKLGSGGKINIRVNAEQDNGKSSIELYDNGAGMDEYTLEHKLAEAFSTGKEDDPTATGGKGIGSVSYIMGGEYFSIDTVAVDQFDGKKYRIQAGGTKAQFQDKNKGSDWEKNEVSDNTPTGTSIKVRLKSNDHDQHFGVTEEMVNDILEFSRDKQSTGIYDEHGIYTSGQHISDLKGPLNAYVKEIKFRSSNDDELIGDFTYKDTNVIVQIPKYDPSVEQRSIKIRYLNNGMYQFTKSINLPEKIRGVPPDVIVNLRPQVEELHPNYPFTNTREHLKDDIDNLILDYVKRHISDPALERKKNRTQELYDSMPFVNIPGTKRKSVIFDPGNRLTPDEVKNLQNDKTVKDLIQFYDKLIDDIIKSTGETGWADRVEGVGLVFDPESNGIHIPNPSTGKSTILFNPYPRINTLNPRDSAVGSVGTGLHETAHVGTGLEGLGKFVSYHPDDVDDPNLPEFVKNYTNEIIKHGDVFTNTGHGMGFVQRLGSIYFGFGSRNTYGYAKELESIFTEGSTSGYSPKIQRLLRLYTERAGRDATTEDLLSRTGVKQANRTSGGTGPIPGNRQANRGRTAPSNLREAFNLPRGLTTPIDISAPFRQGLPLIATKQWWTSWNQMLRSYGSEGAFNKTLKDIRTRRIFQRHRDPVTQKIIKSWAEQAGLAIMDVGTNLQQREEAIASNWAESGGMFGKDNMARDIYKASMGRWVRASNRAYTAYLNQLRADSFESLLKDAKRDFDVSSRLGTLNKTKLKDPYTDLTFAREIANFVNTATGRGSLRLGKAGGRFDWEKNAELLTDAFFAPRNNFAKMNMLNPYTYIMSSPFVRWQYVKALLSVAGTWGTMAALAKLMGADVSTDMNSADFGKIRIGNVRFDPAGGFQQYLVGAHRLFTGHETSSATGRDFELGQGYRPPTRWTIAENFTANKLNPFIKFGYDMWNASEHQPFQVMDRTLQLFIPLIVQDTLELLKEDPTLIPGLAPVAAGMGTQIYDKGQAGSKFIPPEYDWNFTGGELPGVSDFLDMFN
jgi:hypothetical protein